jgi:hypothetical protein
MKPADFYQLTPIEILEGAEAIGELKGCYYNHIPEIVDDLGWLTENTQVFVKSVGYKHIDDRRYWQIAGVWFNEKPIMIIQNAGREGDDHARRFITDEKGFLDMIDYIRKLINPAIQDKIYSIEDNIEDLTEFYGYKWVL